MSKCGEKLIEIVYGMPGPELFEASERGEVILGGCCIGDEDPEYRCKKCKFDYSDDLKKLSKSKNTKTSRSLVWTDKI